MKVRPRYLKGKEKMKYLDLLYSALESLKTREEIKSFLRDVLTESERLMIGRRIAIAQKLLGGASYIEIVNEMKVGLDTINRVHQWLGNTNGGYEKTLKNIEKIFKKRMPEYEVLQPNSFKALKRRYPLHFLLFNLFDEFKKKRGD